MIEIAQTADDGKPIVLILSNREMLCAVAPVMLGGGEDRDATMERAEHIAEALRHYQQSQEAEVTP